MKKPPLGNSGSAPPRFDQGEQKLSPLIAVAAAKPAQTTTAIHLARRLRLPLADSCQSPPPFLLLLTPERLELHQTGKNSPGPIYVDFSSAKLKHRRLHGGGRQQSLARAVGIKGQPALTVIDATAGLGRDAFILASLGCQVRLIERSPLIHALLADGLHRALAVPEIAAIVRARMHLISGDAQGFLAQFDFRGAEVIYLDPMFPKKDKSSLVKKESQVLRQLIGSDPDADKLLTLALSKAQRRVVVKRPRLAPFLVNKSPSFSLSGKSSRFDIYLTAKPG